MWRTLASVGLAVVVFVASGELLARALHIVDRLNGYSRLLYAPGPSRDLPYVLRADLETTLFGIPVRTNQLGFRGPALAPQPAPGVRRIAIVGDSVVFGQGVREDETVSAALARRLAVSDGRFEVVNAGVPGYDAVSEARLLERVVLPLRPEIVVIGTSLNDYDVTPIYSPTGILMRKDVDDRAPTLADRSEFFTLLSWLWAWGHGQLLGQVSERVAAEQAKRPADDTATDGLVRRIREEHLGFYRSPVPKYWDRFRDAYADIARLSAASGVRTLVVIFPEEYQVTDADPDTTPQRLILATCTATGLRCVDLLPAFRAAGGALFADLQHPNGRGLELAADAIATNLGFDSATAAATRGR
jgi:hypothetical protein